MKWLILASFLVLPFAQLVHADESAKIYYDRLFADGRLDMTIALCFEQQKSDQSSIPIIGPILDFFKAPKRDDSNELKDVDDIERALVTCPDCGIRKTAEGTGFKIYGGQFSYGGRPIQLRIKFIYSGPGVSKQGLRDEFVRALGSDDVVLYLGHSRDGAGLADFGSPITTSGKVFANDPILGWTNFEKGYFARNKYQILMINSCLTKHWFRDVLRQKVWEKPPSDLGLILSDDNTWFEDYPENTLALVRGLMRGQSRDELLDSLDAVSNFYHSVHTTDAVQKKLFVGDGLLDQTYAGRPAPKRQQPNEPWHDMPF